MLARGRGRDCLGRTLLDIEGCELGYRQSKQPGRQNHLADCCWRARSLFAPAVGCLVVDEAFMDVIRPGASLATLFPRTRDHPAIIMAKLTARRSAPRICHSSPAIAPGSLTMGHGRSQVRRRIGRRRWPIRLAE